MKLTNIRYPRLIPEIMIWVGSFCSCAIEGNKLGIYMCELWNNDQRQFLVELEKFLNGLTEEKDQESVLKLLKMEAL